MGVLRAAVSAVLMLSAAATAAGQCVAGIRVISTRQSVPNLVAGPIAWGDGVLMVTKFDRTARRLYVSTYDENFGDVTGDLLVSSNTPDGALAIVWNGTEFGLFYRTLNSPARLVLQRITKSGQLLGTPIPVSSRSFQVQDEMDVAWNPVTSRYVIASTDNLVPFRDVWITVMTREGIVERDVNTSVFTAYETADLNVAVTADGHAAIFYASADETIVWTRLEDSAVLVYNVWTRGRDLAVATLGNHYYLVKQVPFGAGTRILWLVLDTDGEVVHPEEVLVSPQGIDARPLSLITNGEELALEYLDFDLGSTQSPGMLRLRRFAPSGAFIADTLFAVDAVQGRAYTEHDFVWTGSSYVTAGVVEQGRDLTSMLIRTCVLRAHITGPGAVVQRDEFVTFTAAPSGGVPGYTYVWNSGDSPETFTGPTFRWRFRSAGTFTVTLKVTDHAGVSHTTTYTVRVVGRKGRVVRH